MIKLHKPIVENYSGDWVGLIFCQLVIWAILFGTICAMVWGLKDIPASLFLLIPASLGLTIFTFLFCWQYIYYGD